MTTRRINVNEHEAEVLHRGRATAIVRPMNPQPIDHGDRWEWRPKGSKKGPYETWYPSSVWRHGMKPTQTGAAGIVDLCPYGRIGDVLLFCEAHAFRTDFVPSSDIGKALHYMHLKSRYEGSLDDEWHHYGKWRPASRMPTWAVQLRYAIASIEVVRVAEMTEEQAKACGAWLRRRLESDHWLGWGGGSNEPEPTPKGYSRRDGLRYIYESLHGEESWMRDHAWLIGIERVER